MNSQHLSVLESNPSIADVSFRSGFVLRIPAPVPDFLVSWKEMSLGPYQLLFNHDCKVLSFESQHGRAICLGEFFICHGSDDLAMIVSQILEFDRIELLDCLSGRFAIIFQRNEDIWIVNDPFGARTVFISTDIRQTAVASHSALLAAVLCKGDRADMRAMIEDPAYRLRGTVYLPGHATRFQDIIHLTPNQRYWLNRKKLERYWPFQDIPPTTMDDFLDLTKEYLAALSQLQNCQ